MPIRHAGIVLLGACALSLAACSKNANKADTTAMAPDTTAKAAAVTPTPPALTDTSILGLLDEANAADSASGALAATKGTSAAVRAFGHQMVRDHHLMRKAGQDLAKKLNITPAAPANDTLPAAAKRMADSLTAEAKGPAWDKAYIDTEVAVHQSVLALLQTAQGAATDTSLKALIQTAEPTVQGHLTKAQSIQGKLSATATGGAAAAGAADTTKPAHKKKG